MATALLLPGQGLHYVGMGRRLATVSPPAAAVFAQADEALSFPLSRLCWLGPAETLSLTEHAQPAILTHSIAALRALQAAEEVAFEAAIGHSLGEWTALVAAGALRFADAVRLVRLRGRLMQEAVAPGVGAMAALAGLSLPEVEALCRESLADLHGRVLSPATLNGSRQIVISGHAEAVEMAGRLARTRGATMVSPLSVSAPFHCALMAPAAGALDATLRRVRWQPPQITVWSTVTARPIADVAEIPSLLVRQLTEPVLWQPTIEAICAAGIREGIALGPARSLKRMARRVARRMSVRVVDEEIGG